MTVWCLCLPAHSIQVVEAAVASPGKRKDDVIEGRASAEAKAVQTIPDQRTFFLDDEAHTRFLALLDSPPAPSAAIRARFSRKAPWES
jgi:uncharacterized protein (DUF1778 family)